MKWWNQRRYTRCQAAISWSHLAQPKRSSRSWRLSKLQVSRCSTGGCTIMGSPGCKLRWIRRQDTSSSPTPNPGKKPLWSTSTTLWSSRRELCTLTHKSWTFTKAWPSTLERHFTRYLRTKWLSQDTLECWKGRGRSRRRSLADLVSVGLDLLWRAYWQPEISTAQAALLIKPSVAMSIATLYRKMSGPKPQVLSKLGLSMAPALWRMPCMFSAAMWICRISQSQWIIKILAIDMDSDKDQLNEENGSTRSRSSIWLSVQVKKQDGKSSPLMAFQRELTLASARWTIVRSWYQVACCRGQGWLTMLCYWT